MLRSTTIRILLSFILILAGAGLHAQSGVKEQVVTALGSGNASALAKPMVANVDLAMPAGDDLYSRAQAEQILRKFFDEHPAQGFTIEHDGTSRVGDSYYIGKLHTAKGDFRVTFLLKKTGDGLQVKQLRVETAKVDR